MDILAADFLFSEYLLTLIPVEDGLLHRPRAVWSITYMNCELNDAEMWLKSALQVEDKKEVRTTRSIFWEFRIRVSFIVNFVSLR